MAHIPFIPGLTLFTVLAVIALGVAYWSRKH